MLTELIGCFNGIKKAQAEMKAASSDLKKNLREPTVEGMNQINDMEHKGGKSIQSEQQEEKRIKKNPRG